MTLYFKSSAVRGAALMVGAGAAFAVVNVAVQGATMQYGASPAAVVFWQYAIALAACLPILNIGFALSSGRWPWHVLRVALAAIGVQFWVHGLALVPIWQAISLILLSPFFVTLGAGVFLLERVTARRWLAVVTGIVGGVIVLAPWTEAFTVAALYPVLAALFWAASSLVTKALAAEEDAGVLTVWLLLLLCPINFGLAYGGGFAVAGVGLVLVAGLGTALAQYMLAAAYRTADAAYLQPFDHVKLPLNLLLGFLAFGFAPEGFVWLGVALIVAAGLGLMIAERDGIADASPRLQDRAAS